MGNELTWFAFGKVKVGGTEFLTIVDYANRYCVSPYEVEGHDLYWTLRPCDKHDQTQYFAQESNGATSISLRNIWTKRYMIARKGQLRSYGIDDGVAVALKLMAFSFGQKESIPLTTLYRLLIAKMNSRLEDMDASPGKTGPRILPLVGISENRREAIMEKVQEAVAGQGKIKQMNCGITLEPVIKDGALNPGMSALVIKRNDKGVTSYYVEFFDFEAIKRWRTDPKYDNLHPISKEKCELSDIVPLFTNQ